MSAECLVIASNTPPVTEVIKDGQNGLLFDFFSPREIADRVDEVLTHPDEMAQIRQNARETILKSYDLKDLLPKQIEMITDLAGNRV